MPLRIKISIIINLYNNKSYQNMCKTKMYVKIGQAISCSVKNGLTLIIGIPGNTCDSPVSACGFTYPPLFMGKICFTKPLSLAFGLRLLSIHFPDTSKCRPRLRLQQCSPFLLMTPFD